MTTENPKEHQDTADERQGGNLETKGASHAEQRQGGNLETKGASKTSPSERAEKSDAPKPPSDEG